jgi:hypothetical protein
MVVNVGDSTGRMQAAPAIAEDRNTNGLRRFSRSDIGPAIAAARMAPTALIAASTVTPSAGFIVPGSLM